MNPEGEGLGVRVESAIYSNLCSRMNIRLAHYCHQAIGAKTMLSIKRLTETKGIFVGTAYMPSAT